MSFCGPPGGEPCPQLPRLPAHHPPALQAPFGANGPFSMAGLHTGTRERGSAAELGSRLVPRVPGRLHMNFRTVVLFLQKMPLRF